MPFIGLTPEVVRREFCVLITNAANPGSYPEYQSYNNKYNTHRAGLQPSAVKAKTTAARVMNHAW